MLTEALLSGVTEAVFEYFAKESGLARKVRHWLGRDPQQIGFKKAMARAYTAFARQYPELTSSLFDVSFLSGEASHELAKLFTRHAYPDPVNLVDLWAESIGVPKDKRHQWMRQRNGKLAIQAAADFLDWLESELKAEPVFNPLFNSRALESLPAIEDQIDELAERLTDSFEIALAQARQYDQIVMNYVGFPKVDDGPVDAADDRVAVSTILHNYFSGDYAMLNDLYISPDAVFQRVQVERFIGREWLESRVDKFLNDMRFKSGVFLLEGEAGVGKTAFMAHLVYERRYLHLFSEQAPGNGNLPRALQSLASQLVARYRIQPYAQRDTLPQVVSSQADFLDKLLRIAASRLASGEKLVIVCDALDEAGTAPGGNVLGLPSILPDNVYLILSQRPVPTRLFIENPLDMHRLEASGDENLADMEGYLQGIVEESEIALQLSTHGYSKPDFVRILLEKSSGVWMYLHYVVNDIRAGVPDSLDLTRLPSGLAGYYSKYWSDWKEGRNGRGEGSAAWDALYAPLLATLASTQEAIDIKLLMTWSKVGATAYKVRRLLKETWRPFIVHIGEDDIENERYNFYHVSLRDFISGKMPLQDLPSESRYLVEELRNRVHKAHKRIVEHYRDHSKGDWPTIVDQGYPRRHLARHMYAAGAFEDLYDLVAQKCNWANARYLKDGDFDGFLTDLHLAWQWFESDEGQDLGRQLRCALVESSIHSLAENIWPRLHLELVKAGEWSPEKTVSHIMQIGNNQKRAFALIQIASVLPRTLIPEVMETARKIDWRESYRGYAFVKLWSFLPDKDKLSFLSEALQMARAIPSECIRLDVLGDIVGALPRDSIPEVLTEAMAIIEETESDESRFQGLAYLAENLPDDLQEDLRTRVEEEAVKIFMNLPRGNDSRAYALCTWRSNLPVGIRGFVLDALTEARAVVEDPRMLFHILTQTARHLPSRERGAAFCETLEITSRSYGEERAFYLMGLAEELPVELKGELLASARTIVDPRLRVETMMYIAGRLPKDLAKEAQREALAAVKSIDDEYDRAKAVIGKLGWRMGVIQLLPEKERLREVRSALVLANQIEDLKERDEAILALSEYLPSDLMADELASLRRIKDSRKRTDALVQLMDHLQKELIPTALRIAEDLPSPIPWAKLKIRLANTLDTKSRIQALLDALDESRRMPNGEAHFTYAFIRIAVQLPERQKVKYLEEAVKDAREIADARNRLFVLLLLAKHLSDLSDIDIYEEILEAAIQVENPYDRFDDLFSLVPQLPEPYAQEAISLALNALEGISADPWCRSLLLSKLAEYARDEQKTLLLEEVAKATREMSNPWDRVVAMTDMAKHLPEGPREKVLAEASDLIPLIKSMKDRVEAVAKVAEQLVSDSKSKLILTGFEYARSILDKSDSAEALVRLMKHMPASSQEEILDAVLQKVEESGDYNLLVELIAHVPTEMMADILDGARGIESFSKRANIIEKMEPYITNDQRVEAIESIKRAASATAREAMTSPFPTQALVGITLTPTLKYLEGDFKIEALRIALQSANSLGEIVSNWMEIGFEGLGTDMMSKVLRTLSQLPRKVLIRRLVELTPALDHLGTPRAVQEMLRAIIDVGAWWP